ncbi:hypothetical protein WMQ13_24435 [Escherichia coli]|uniref:hypothetical protein n=1 Tax=Escherichia coli TaxID=562 RepID=UPI0034A20438
MWVDIEAPEGVTEKDYQFLPSKADHFSGGKITRTFSTSKPGADESPNDFGKNH